MRVKGVLVLALVGIILIAGGFTVSTSLGIAATVGVIFSSAVTAFAFVAQRRERAGIGEEYDPEE